ncbi:MAG: SDR family oxidoreductase [Dehalococcoidales bacterium]|jgi:3-oxoacyl-[acyl-carrier protein] reductase
MNRRLEFNFHKKVVLITGATRGIGKQLASDFENLGAELILTGTNLEKINELNKNSAKNARYFYADFTKEESLQEFIRKLADYKKIDVCINNAGINRINYLTETLMEDWDDIIKVNLRAPFALCRQVARLMKNNGYGRIVNIASIFGVISKEKRSIYSSSKSGLIGLTKAMAIELAPHNILVNCLSPGFVLTDLTRQILSESEIKDLESKIPAKRLATPQDVSNVVLFLSSDLNTYITGQNIIVDGGFVSA